MNHSERKKHNPEEKASILRRHLIEKVPVCNLCEEFGLHPTVFYPWLKQFFENGAAAFQNHRPDRSRQCNQERRRRVASACLYGSTFSVSVR